MAPTHLQEWLDEKLEDTRLDHDHLADVDDGVAAPNDRLELSGGAHEQVDVGHAPDLYEDDPASIGRLDLDGQKLEGWMEAPWGRAGGGRPDLTGVQALH